MRTLLLFVLATLVVIGLITGLFLGNLRQNQREAIVLPDAAQSAQTGEQPPDQPEAALLDVTRENVQSIVRSLHRPQYYHQTYTVTRRLNGVGQESEVELWVSDHMISAILRSGSRERHILTDGQTRYVCPAAAGHGGYDDGRSDRHPDL